jgi:hypothetical protein
MEAARARRRGDRIAMLYAAVRRSLMALNGQPTAPSIVAYWANNGQKSVQALNG